MRIAYVSLHWPRTLESGVGKKIAHQINLWRKAGHEVQFFMHMQSGACEKELVPGISTIYRDYPGLVGRIRTETERSLAVVRLLPLIRKFEPDLIYLRWGMYVFPAHRLFHIAPVVMEINTNDIFQHGLLGFAYGIYNRLTRGIFLNRAAGLVSASSELAKDPDFARYHKPVRIIANGITIDASEKVKAPNNRIPRLVFIGTPGLPWHGVDKLVELARNFPDIIVDVIGYDHLDGFGSLPENLHLHGYLSSTDYEKILAMEDVGIGTLALHRKGMEEASPLKTRECLAFGMPMVIPYMDSDIDNLHHPCILHIPNNEENIQTCGKKIRDFAYEMRGKRILPAELVGRIGMNSKEKTRLEFFEECRQAARPS